MESICYLYIKILSKKNLNFWLTNVFVKYYQLGSTQPFKKPIKNFRFDIYLWEINNKNNQSISTKLDVNEFQCKARLKMTFYAHIDKIKLFYCNSNYILMFPYIYLKIIQNKYFDVKEKFIITWKIKIYYSYKNKVTNKTLMKIFKYTGFILNNFINLFVTKNE